MPRPNEASRLAADVTSRVLSAPDSTVAGLRLVRRQISRELTGTNANVVVDLATRLIEQGNVPRWFVYELLSHHADALRALTPQQIEDLGRGLSSWGDVDAFACYVAGPAWREGSLTTADLERWSASSDRWWRRAALVSTVPLNNKARGGSAKGNAPATLHMCDLLKHDRDDMVVKALSWALRELAKKDPHAVEAYLAKHKEELAPRVVREVRNKLTTGLKNPGPKKPRSTTRT